MKDTAAGGVYVPLRALFLVLNVAQIMHIGEFKYSTCFTDTYIKK